MRREMSQAVRKEFASQLDRRLPHFARDQASNVPPEVVQYVWGSANKQLLFYVCLQFHRIWDRFTIELAWSSQGRYPGYAPPAEPEDEAPTGEMRFRLSRLWASSEDVWWEPLPGGWANKKELHARIEPVVSDAMEKLVTYGVPYMERVTEQRGLTRR